ncbi:uncharacterized protein DUF4255 [Algoriphagus antarcticus]|uniref:Uncharacterized protein DUF4255 n=2 Tax=Algoriphagus antarcticus TaxID=238540 RepID=A0A3E0DMU2_9BACT|nr:uncharacterized protein DUF4255 [Algoriphagus antarcticus]
MLRTALEFLTEELNLYMKVKDPINFGNVDCVILSGLMNPDGTFAIPMDQGNDSFKVILTLINLEEDRIAESQLSYQKKNDNFQVINPPVNINALILFSVYATSYPTALRLLSNVISFFQSNTVFTPEKYPHLNAKVEEDKPWEKLEKLLVNLYGTTLEQQNNLWAALGAKYMPNVIYKIRTMSFIDHEPKMQAPPITEINIFES